MDAEKYKLDVEENDFICIVGPSGCGKSTYCIIAGLEDATEGKINYKGKELLEPTSEIGWYFKTILHGVQYR